MKFFVYFFTALSIFIAAIEAAPHECRRVKKVTEHKQSPPQDRAKKDREEHRLDAQIMAQNFVNIVIQMFIAAHKEHDKEARVQAVTQALMSLANIFKLILRSNPANKNFNNQEELVALIRQELADALLVEECEIALNKRSRHLRTDKLSK